MSHVIPSVSPKEVLTKIKLVFGQDSLEMIGTDLNQNLKITTPCESDEPGIALVSYENLKAIISKMSGEMINFSFAQGKVIVSDNFSSFELGGHCDIDEFPGFGSFPSCEIFSFPVDKLVTIVDSIAHCMDKESTRYSLGSVQICGIREQGVIKLTATDGRRISLFKSACEGIGSFSAMIPHNVVKAIPAILGGLDGDCMIRIDPSWLMIETPHIVYLCRQSEGRFPNCQRFEKQFEEANLVELDLAAMRAIASQGLAVSENDETGLSLHFDGQSVTASHHTQKAKFRATIPLAHPEASVIVNAQYLHQALSNCKSASLQVVDNTVTIQRDKEVYECIMGMAK
jgi:DNA polymerase III sliding clamp (beta) subunit (PCNA family)